MWQSEKESSLCIQKCDTPLEFASVFIQVLQSPNYKLDLPGLPPILNHQLRQMLHLYDARPTIPLTFSRAVHIRLLTTVAQALVYDNFLFRTQVNAYQMALLNTGGLLSHKGHTPIGAMMRVESFGQVLDKDPEPEAPRSASPSVYSEYEDGESGEGSDDPAMEQPVHPPTSINDEGAGESDYD
jgi:hypothetical protein